MPKDIQLLHSAMIDLVALMNRPQNDEGLLREAGVSLDRALFPLLVGIEHLGPVSVGDLAERAGRDHTTVSRQIGKLESLGLIERMPGPTDRRVTQSVLTPSGRTVIAAIDTARERIAAPILERWSDADFEQLTRLMRRFVDDLMDTRPGNPPERNG
jgi:DNA-binding MarR family transcriptional regulator